MRFRRHSARASAQEPRGTYRYMAAWSGSRACQRLAAASRESPLQGALIGLEPETGAVRAFVGGRDYRLSQFNRVTQAHRQPGSLFKPFVYLAAFARREAAPPVTPATILDDSPVTVAWDERE